MEVNSESYQKSSYNFQSWISSGGEDPIELLSADVGFLCEFAQTALRFSDIAKSKHEEFL